MVATERPRCFNSGEPFVIVLDKGEQEAHLFAGVRGLDQPG